VQYSIVIPAYNESTRIGGTIEKILAFSARSGWEAEILIVNDGSRDDTAHIVRQYAAGNPALRLLENPGNHGKGYSVRNGVLHAQGQMILFSDADLSSPIEESAALFAALAEGADVAVGSRWLRSELQTRRQPWHRQLYGRIFNLLLRVILGLQYKDTQCGFKAFTRRAALTIFPLQKIERWGFDPEILYLARRFGFRVKEVPVRWAHREGTRLNPLRDGMRMFWEVLKIRWFALGGKYDASAPSPAPTL
jgi:glycosyltransferase involved in cell wall biosynthesis